MKAISFNDTAMRESFEKHVSKLEFPWFLVKWVLITLGAIIIAFLVLLGYAYNLIDGAFTKVIRLALESNIGAQEADIKYWVSTITFLLSFFILWLILNLWKHKFILSGLAVLFFMAAYLTGLASNKEVFGVDKDARWMCPGPTPQHLQEISRTSKNSRAKSACKEITNPTEIAVATYLLDQKEKGQPVQKAKLIPYTEIERDDFALMANDVQKVHKSKVLSSKGLPMIYDNPDFDNVAGGLLVPVTLEDLAKIRAFLAKEKNAEKVKEDAAANEKVLKEKQDFDAKAAAEKAAKLKAEKEEVEYKKGVYKNVTEVVTDLKQEKQKLEEEERRNGSARTTQKSKAPRRGDDNVLTVHRGMYVVSMTNLVNVYVDEKKASIPFTSEAFEELHSQGKKIQIATEGCWFCEEWVTLGTIVKNNKKRIDEIDQALRMYARDLEDIRRQIPELAKLSTSERPVRNQTSSSTSNVGGDVVMSFLFVNRDPPKPSFEFSVGTSGAQAVKPNSDGVYIQGRGKACGKIEVLIDNGLQKFDICDSRLSNTLISGGRTYEVINSTNAAVYTANRRK